VPDTDTTVDGNASNDLLETDVEIVIVLTVRLEVRAGASAVIDQKFLQRVVCPPLISVSGLEA
jgi:hypothetical protein